MRRSRQLAAAILPALTALACGVDSRAVVAPVTACKGVPVERALIADFTGAIEGPDVLGNPGVRFPGGALDRGGSTLVFAAEGLAKPRVSLTGTATGNPALQIDATPGVPLNEWSMWLGASVTFAEEAEACVDASAYWGVQFTLEGTPGTCVLMFQVEISQDYDVGTGSPNAACTLGPDHCYPPFSRPITVLPGRNSYPFPFTALSEGSPIRLVDPTTITNLSWKLWAPFEGPPCEAHLVVDDVAFYKR